MADDTGADSSSKSEPSSEQFPKSSLGQTSLRHEKPIIEGEIVREEPDAGEQPGDAAPAPDAEAPTHEAPAPDRVVAAPPRSGSVWPIAASIIIGAGLAVGGAYGLHMLDGTSDTLAALAARNDELTERLAKLETKPETGASLADVLAGQDKRLRAAEQQTDKALAAANSALAAAKADATPAASTGAPQTVDLGPIDARLDALEHRLSDLEEKIAKLAAPPKTDVRAPEEKAVRPPAEADAAATAIIAANLVGKVEHGLGYAPELAALKSRSVDKSRLSVLEPTAATGVATPHALLTQFAGVSETLLAPESQKTETGGSFFDRLGQSGLRLFRIGKSGQASGKELAARLGRIKDALVAGSLEEALAQWDGLPEAAKVKSEGFGKALKARIDATVAARGIQSDAVAALTKSKS